MKKKYNKFIKIDGTTLIVGIDIGKNFHYGFFLTMTEESSKSFKFSNSREGFNVLIKKIESFLKKNNISNVVIGVESTGNYWLPLAYYIEQHTDYTLVQVNGKHTKRFKEVTDNSPNKTDQKDPKVIAQVVQIGSGLGVNLPKGTKATVRELTRSRKALKEDRKRTVNRLHAVLSLFFPEIMDLFRDISCKTCIHILKTYPTPKDISLVSVDFLAEELKRISRGRFGIEKVKSLLSAVFNGIGVKDGIDAFSTITKTYIEQIEQYDVHISEQEKQIKQILVTLDEYSILSSIDGIGDITIATIISEVGEFYQFQSYKELIKFGGLNLVENSSGNHRGNRRISKVGNEHLRTSLYFAVLRLIKKSGIYHAQYQKHLEKGMEKKKAIIAISRKLLRTIHSLIKNKETFCKDYEIEQIKIAA